MSINIATRPLARVLVVDDSAFMRTALARMIASEHGFEVVGIARSGREALDCIAALDPDVITLDIEMPGLNGLDTLRQIMLQFPRPVIMVSSTSEGSVEATFEALGAGAFDYVPKKMAPDSLDILHIRPDLIAKIRAAAFSQRAKLAECGSPKPPRSVLHETLISTPTTPAIVAIGTSTGGPKALQEILPLFPRDLPVPILIVQHMPLGFTQPFAQRLNSLCSIFVREAADGEVLRPGTAYIAPAGMHMTVSRSMTSRTLIHLDTQPDSQLHMPSVDVLMKSVAENFRTQAMGVILTGMGSDGVEGIKAIHEHGGFTIAQDEPTCAVYGMPRACAQLGILNRIVPLEQVPAQIIQAVHYRKHA